MAKEQKEPLTGAEWKVMRLVWRRGECAARDVYVEAGKRYGWAPTTAKTVLRRLVEKGHLTTAQVGNSFLYRPAERVVRSSLIGAADVLLENLLEGTTGMVLQHLVRKGRLTAREVAELRALLDAKQAQPDEEG